MAAAQPQFQLLVEHDIVVTEDEIEAYAGWVGIDVEFERDLFKLAREGAEAKLPEGWRACIRTDRPNDLFYWHAESNKSTWEHPLDEVYRQKVEEARGQRRCRVITLNLITHEKGLALLGTNLEGEEVTTIPCADTDDFASVEDKLRVDLAKEGVVLCFAKVDGTLLGHSARAQTVSQLF